MWKSEKKAGMCPSCAPVANSRAEVNKTPLTPPNVDSATNTGIIQLQPANKRSPNTYRKKKKKLKLKDWRTLDGHYYTINPLRTPLTILPAELVQTKHALFFVT